MTGPGASRTEPSPRRGNDGPSFSHRAATVVVVVALVYIGLFLLWRVREAVFLAFAGVLVAILLRAPADWLAEHTPLPRGWALAPVLLGLVALLALVAWWRGPAVVEQVDVLHHSLPTALRQVTERLRGFSWGQRVLDQLQPLLEAGETATGMVDRAQGALFNLLAVMAKLLVILFMGVFLAAEPGWYRRGIVMLVPERQRDRAHTVLRELGTTLRSWLLVRLSTMTFVGVCVATGLWLLDVPLVFTLALLAALLDFVPNFGPILAATPAVLLAFMQSPTRALYVALLYLGVQLVEAYVVTPTAERRAVQLPPALVLGMQVSLGMLVGLEGLALAAPVTLVVIVLTRMLYVEGVLREST